MLLLPKNTPVVLHEVQSTLLTHLLTHSLTHSIAPGMSVNIVNVVQLINPISDQVVTRAARK
jgi:hypothetical protein